mmetsp:Transcript_4787/g.8449  ORF Transcript_4787/g.8449 Transcript_4787/m.8449 type:complete len:266 (+) Transcript_4787:35-832(+)
MGKKRPFSRVRNNQPPGKDAGGGGDSAVSDNEKKRRERQRKLREIAIRERQNGREYKKYKAKRSLAITESRENGSWNRSKDDRRKSGKRKGEFDVVIIPIGWLERHYEYERILNACRELHQGLCKENIRCAIDDSNDFMPGTKFKFWEEQGVKLRVELGPRDMNRQLLTIAKTTVPGRLAEKQTIKHISSQQVADHLKRIIEGFAGEKQHIKFSDDDNSNGKKDEIGDDNGDLQVKEVADEKEDEKEEEVVEKKKEKKEKRERRH